jgi:hypothetical protein
MPGEDTMVDTEEARRPSWISRSAAWLAVIIVIAG